MPLVDSNNGSLNEPTSIWVHFKLLKTVLSFHLPFFRHNECEDNFVRKVKRKRKRLKPKQKNEIKKGKLLVQIESFKCKS